MTPASLSTAPDERIVRLATEGNEPAQHELVRRFRPVVFNLVLRVVEREDAAEDLTQEILLKVLDALEDRGPTRNPAAWIHTIARNTSLNYVTRARPDAQYRSINVTPTAVQLSPSRTPTPQPDLDGFDKELKRAIRHLKPQDRACARLFLQQGLSHREIADKLNLPLGTVKTSLRRARQQLQGPLGHWRESLNAR